MNFKKGQKVKVVGNKLSGHCFNIGTRLKIVKKHKSQPAWYCRRWIFGLQQIIREEEMELIKS